MGHAPVRVITVEREYGSRGGEFAHDLAERLGWRLLDAELINRAAQAAGVDPKTAARFDERLDPWYYRYGKLFWHDSSFSSIGMGEDHVFDSQRMLEIIKQQILKAAKEGNCVIVGRGAQCILQHKQDAFHVFVYAPLRERIERLKKRLETGADVEQRLRSVDGQRAKYLHQQFGRHWCDPHLYDLMLRSTDDEEGAARVILYAMTGAPVESSKSSAVQVGCAG